LELVPGHCSFPLPRAGLFSFLISALRTFFGRHSPPLPPLLLSSLILNLNSYPLLRRLLTVLPRAFPFCLGRFLPFFLWPHGMIVPLVKKVHRPSRFPRCSPFLFLVRVFAGLLLSQACLLFFFFFYLTRGRYVFPFEGQPVFPEAPGFL